MPAELVFDKDQKAQRDGDVGDIEYIPVKAESVETKKIGDRAMRDPVAEIARRAPQNQTDPDNPRRLVFVGGGEPYPKPCHGEERHENQRQPPAQSFGLEPAIADALVPSHDDIQKGRERDPRRLIILEELNEKNLGKLIGGESGERDGKPLSAGFAPERKAAEKRPRHRARRHF